MFGLFLLLMYRNNKLTIDVISSRHISVTCCYIPCFASIFSCLSAPQVPTVKCRRLETVDAGLGRGVGDTWRGCLAETDLHNHVCSLGCIDMSISSSVYFLVRILAESWPHWEEPQSFVAVSISFGAFNLIFHLREEILNGTAIINKQIFCDVIINKPHLATLTNKG